MISSKISDIVSMLIETTKSGDLVWIDTKIKPTEDDFNNESILLSKSEDGLTKFEISVKFSLAGDKWTLESSCGLWIRNKSLPGGSMYLLSHNNPEIVILRNLLNDKFCNLTPSSDLVEIRLSEIYKGISKSTFRNNLITKVFGGKKD